MDTIVPTLNTAGRAFVHFALPMLLQSSLLILLLLAVDMVLRRRVRAVLRYWIWMLVLVKLILPPSLWSPVSLGTWVGNELEVSTAALLEPEPAPLAEMPPAAPLSAAAHILSAPDPAFVAPVEPLPQESTLSLPLPPDGKPRETRPPGPALTWQGFVLLLWGVTVVALLFLLLQRAYFVRGLVAQAEQAGHGMLGVLEECRAHLGLRCRVALRLSPNATSPAVCGLLRPTILIPQSLAPRLQGRDLRAVLLHELAHIRRGDLWVNLAQTLLQIAYFYHPLLWLANALLRRAREQAVDEMVLVAMGETAAQYPETLVSVAKLAFRRRPVLSLRLVGVVESKSALSARIKHMLTRPLPRSAKLGLLGLSTVVAAAVILLPMAAAAERPLSEGGTGPLEIRFVGVCPDESGEILDATGKKVEEMPYPLASKPVWQPDRLRRDFVFEVPETREPALFVRYRLEGAEGWWQQADRTPLMPVQVSGRRLLFVREELPRVWRKPILGILPRNILLDKMDITLEYFYGSPRQTRLSFAGPFQEGQTCLASGGAEGQLNVLSQQPVMPQSEPRPRFRLQAPVVMDAHTMIVLYDTGGARHIAGWMKGRFLRDPGTTVDFSPGDGSLTLPQIARIAVEEPYELTAQNVRVSYPDRPARDHAAYLDVMAERLGLTTLPPEELANYQFTNPQDAIAVLDIIPGGDLARQAVVALTYGQPRVNLPEMDEPARGQFYTAARKWAASSDLRTRLLGVQLGLLGDHPEFFARAVSLLADDYHDLADTSSIQNDLDQLVWLLLNRHRAELTPPQRDELTLHHNGRRTLPILGSTSKATAPSATVDTAGDSDGDGLSDFQEVHKYLTDPAKKDSDGDGTPDGDWNERREYAYSVRTVLRYLPPFDGKGLNDDLQDARVLKQSAEYIEVEVIHYPLATGYDAIPENPNWRRDYAREARLAEYLAPGVTTNWDEPMKRDLVAAVKKDGIDVETLTDKQVVERVSSWLLKRSRYLDSVFTTYYVDFPQGTPRIYPGLEDAFRHEFERDSRNYDWPIEQHFDHELLGKGMFYNKTHGSCTSTAVYLTTVLRALGIPTRMVLVTPAVDASDRAQVLMVKNAITHHRVRLTMLAGLGRSSHGFSNHTFNEVYVGNRWCRLDYTQLGCSSLGVQRFGLQTHLYTFNDLRDVNFAPTWGRRYARGEHSDVFQHDNPYSAVAVSELFGPHGNVPNPLFTAQDLWPDLKPSIFLFTPSSVQVGQEFLNLVAAGTGNRTIRLHEKEFYDNLFNGLWLTRPQDIVVLLLALDTPERVPTGYEDLLPRPWPEIESSLKRGETVELRGKARDLNVILLAAATGNELKTLVPNSRLLRAISGAGSVPNIAGAPPAVLASSATQPAKLPNGVTVELLGVSEYPSEGKPWWRPDGSTLTAAPYRTTNNKREPKEGYRDYELVVRYGGAPDTDIQWDVPGSASTGITGNPYDADGRQIHDLTVCTVRFPQTQTTMEVRIGAAAGAWETRATHQAVNREGAYNLGNGRNVAFGIAHFQEGRTLVPVTTNFFHRDIDFRVVAVRGRDEACTGGLSGVGGDTLNSLTYIFDGPLSDIQELRFQTRPWTWATFPNVSLRPSGRTEVRTERARAESGETTASQNPPAQEQTVATRRVVPPEDALQRLLDASPAGGVVEIPEGRYTTPVEITKPVVLRGASQEGCVIDVTADQPAVLVNTGGRGEVTVENVTIRWQLATAQRIERPTALLVKDTNARIRNCRFVPLGDFRRSPTAVYIDGRSNSTVDNCRFSGFEYTVCYGPNTQGVVQDCIITDCGHQGVINYDGATLTVQRCLITGSKFHAVRCTGGTLDVKDSLLIKNANRGIYLGNKTGRGTITNNVILGNGSGISGFGRADYVIADNVVMDNQYAGIDMRDSCRFSIHNNVLAKNQRGLVLFKEGSANANTVGKNAFWGNATEVENLDQPADAIAADPQFADPNHGDFTVRGSVRDDGQGLTNPKVIQQLWARYEQLQRERLAPPEPASASSQAPSPRAETSTPSPAPAQSPGPLQQRINAAAPGATIRLEPGLYKESLFINKPLTLEGAGWDKTVIVKERTAFQTPEDIERMMAERAAAAKNDAERQEIMARMKKEFTEKLSPLVLTVENTQDVVIRGIKFAAPGTRIKGGSINVPLLRLDRSRVRMLDCAVVAGPGDGVHILNGSGVEIEKTLVAAVWGTGIVVGPGPSESGVRIHDCDIRNCHYAGMGIGKNASNTRVERCRISGAAWHGIRYDDAAPHIVGNLLFGHARFGIYASGQTAATVRNNLFYANEMTGMACWFQSNDLIEGNTFASNKEANLAVLGAAKPHVQRNIFYGSPVGVSLGDIGADTPFAKSDGTVALRDNLFWLTERELQLRRDANATEILAVGADTGTVRGDPGFTAPASKDFSLRADSSARQSGIGAGDLLPFDSPWPLQPEELAIIPKGDTRDWRQWREPN